MEPTHDPQRSPHAPIHPHGACWARALAQHDNPPSPPLSKRAWLERVVLSYLREIQRR